MLIGMSCRGYCNTMLLFAACISVINIKAMHLVFFMENITSLLCSTVEILHLLYLKQFRLPLSYRFSVACHVKRNAG